MLDPPLLPLLLLSLLPPEEESDPLELCSELPLPDPGLVEDEPELSCMSEELLPEVDDPGVSLPPIAELPLTPKCE